MYNCAVGFCVGQLLIFGIKRSIGSKATTNWVKKDNPGFDAILGNPPYISTQTSSDFDYRPALTYRFGFVDDLYVHFTFQGFNLLRTGGMFGYIVSDTFFTLGTKLEMRKLLQSKRLHYLGQCDPFNATVDAAIFVAENTSDTDNYSVDFIQARYASKQSTPDRELPRLGTGYWPKLIAGGEGIHLDIEKQTVFHGSQGCLRLHRVCIEGYRRASKRVFFEPTQRNILLHNRFISDVNDHRHRRWLLQSNVGQTCVSKTFADHSGIISRFLPAQR